MDLRLRNLVNRTTIKRDGMFDKNYSIYWEETQWCICISRAGWKIISVPQAHISHKGVKRDYQPNPYVICYTKRNHLFTLARHKTHLKVWVHLSSSKLDNQTALEIYV
jgi:hypothetical protein